MAEIFSNSSATHPPEDTIAAIATSPGPGGIGIIRISGSLSLPILSKIFSPRSRTTSFSSHRLYYGWIIHPQTDKPIDEVLAVYMQAPRTYTRENIVEIHCHGSYLLLEDILRQIIALGASLAKPGEFTKRAFLNGRIDLTQAEAVIELLQAQTSEGLGLAMSQLRGHLGAVVGNIKKSLTTLLAIIEVAIDFPEDDVEIIDAEAMQIRLKEEIIAPLRNLITAANKGKIFREGISVIILGKPNVGKSSLLNALLKEERAIVTAIPGTTRDTIEEVLDIRGMPVHIIDTAGIRDNAEEVEERGIERAKSKAAKADLVLLMLDASTPIDENDQSLYASLKTRKILLVINKIDLAGFDRSSFELAFPDIPMAAISAKNHEGMSELEESLFGLVTGGRDWDPGNTCVPNVRQRISLEGALAAAEQISTGLATALPADLLAIEIQGALDHLGDIIGETTTEDVLDLIFEEFCIGK